MSYGAFQYNTTFTTTYEGSGVQQLTFELEGVKQKTREVSQEASMMGTITSRSFRMGIFGAQMMIWYTSMLMTAQTRQETTALQLENAQDAYNRAVREYGPASEQAIRAGRQLEITQMNVNRANQLATLSYIGMGLQMVSFTASTLNALPALGSWVTSLWSAVTAQTALNAATGQWHKIAAVGLAVGAVGGLAAGITIQSQFNMKGTTEEDLNKALAEHDRKARYEFRRASG
jgi:hypothetical protein